MSASWTPPQDFKSRPVAVLGGGVLGRRIGAVWASAGFKVRIRDPSERQRQDALQYIRENVHAYARLTGRTPSTDVSATESLADAVRDAWLVTEAVPEKLDMKLDIFAELEKAAPADSILATNSSSYKSSQMVAKVSDATKARILNMHYYMPPTTMIVELMTDGYTDSAIFPFLVEQCKAAALLPFVARKESTGFIFNRLWAAIKREILTILAEDVSTPAEIDAVWAHIFGVGIPPCQMMDQVGLDTVALIEKHYIQERGLSSEKTVDFLEKNYISQNKLGAKGALGGLHPPPSTEPKPAEPTLVVLDIGLAATCPSFHSGRVLSVTPAGKVLRVLAENQAMPDGVAIDTASQRMFWTNMGVPGKRDGSVLSARLDGSDPQIIVAVGQINTPKQLVLDAAAHKVYFSDREGLRVYRCNYDGSDLEPLVITGDADDAAAAADATNWCVGIAVVPQLGRFFWTQKGPSKAGQGRILSAGIDLPAGADPAARPDVVTLLSGLPEPIDIEIDEATNTLYWTDRGELPFGNSLNRVPLTADGTAAVLAKPAVPGLPAYEVLARTFNEAIGLRLDLERGRIFVTDLGGSIYTYDLATKKKARILSSDDQAFTGITLY